MTHDTGFSLFLAAGRSFLSHKINNQINQVLHILNFCYLQTAVPVIEKHVAALLNCATPFCGTILALFRAYISASIQVAIKKAKYHGNLKSLREARCNLQYVLYPKNFQWPDYLPFEYTNAIFREREKQNQMFYLKRIHYDFI